MSAFLVFHTTIKDPDRFRQYASRVGATLAPFGGEVAQRGRLAQVLDGSHDHQMVGILKFPSLQQADAWYQSVEYRALLPVRHEAADMTVLSFEEPVPA